MDGFNGGGFPNFSGGFPFPSPLDGSCGGGFSMSSSLLDVAGGEASSPGSWNNGGFMSYFSSQPHNAHLVGAINQAHNNGGTSPSEVEVLSGNENEHDNEDENQNVIAEKRTEKRIMWNVDEDVRLMSAWIEHSTDSTCGADRVVSNIGVRLSKHITRLPLHFEDVVGPFMLTEVWKICRDVPKWKTYNDNLKNARKRKSFHLEADSEENEDTCDETPTRPMGQKQAKMAALAAKKGKGSSSSDDGHSKESPIELDKFERYSKFQEANNDKRMKMLDRQEKIASEKLEATRLAQLTAQDYREGKKLEKETKMMETYNNLASQDTSSMTDEEKAHRLSMLKKLEKAIFPEIE